MSDITPTHIAIHQQSRIFEIHFSDSSEFELPFEYLRVFSPSAEVKAAKNRGEVIQGKKEVVITGAEPVGSYALRLIFNDGHDTGVYSWTTLYSLANNHAENWQQYQQDLAAVAGANNTATSVTVLLFMTLAELADCESIEIDMTPDIKTIADLIGHVRAGLPALKDALQAERITITVNKQFASLEHAVIAGDEIAFVPKGGS